MDHYIAHYVTTCFSSFKNACVNQDTQNTVQWMGPHHTHPEECTIPDQVLIIIVTRCNGVQFDNTVSLSFC